MKKLIFLLSLVLLVSCALVSCGDSADTTAADTTASEDTSVDSTPTDKKLIVDSNGTKYVMVVPENAKSLYTLCSDIKGEIYSKVSKNVFVKYDASQDAGQYEILVGMTNREESKSLGEGLGANEYHIKWVGDKLVVAAGSNYAAKVGAKWLLDMHIKAATSEGVYIPADLDKKGSANMNLDFEGLKAGWTFLMYPADNGVELPYQIYMPANYDKNKQYPLILQMHSAGVKNDDGSQINAGEAKFLRNLEKSKYKDDVIVISPCCPVGEKWIPAKTWKEITYDFVNTSPEPYMVATTELFASARQNLSVDESRLYVYGMSMGGFATWDLLARNPDLFAAAIPVAGAGDPSVVSKLSKTAIWMFHGTEDPTVPCASSQAMYDALIAAGRTDVKFTKFEGAGHGIWGMTADTEGILDWLFAQKRS